ncbi:MAG: patatin-like phospholipase family protein [Planctomycetes bacterium]|nr:patatin-like phospholipase family protein [Planctomycetota bacterium]
MSDEILILLKVHEYFRGISDLAFQDVARIAKVVSLPVGEIVHQPDQPVTSIRFVLRGRLKGVKVDSHGRETLFRMIERGDQFGMMIGALQEQVPLRIFTLEPTTLIEIDYEQAMELTLKHQDLRLQWLKSFAGTLQQHFFGKSTKRAPMMLGLIHESPASRLVGRRLIERLRELGENIAVFSDSDELRNLPDVRLRSLQVDGRPLELAEIRQQASDWQDANRIIFDIHTQLHPERVEQLMQLVDRAVYFVPASESDSAIRRLQQLDVPGRGWRDKLSIAWLLEKDRIVAPAVANLQDFVSRDFKISDTPPQSPWGRSLSSGLERLVHDLRGVRIGVALGGGAARGMSHLGVLKALEENGIVVDMIAGTSAGALTGIVYATGLEGDYSADRFSTDLTPSWIFRRLPRGDYWFLLYQYRRNHFDRMLRKYLNDWKLEQLAIPCLSVTVDLVSGQSVVRERGDAVHAILESINLPVLSVPICRNGQALVDGGLVNNIPADVLASKGCNFVIAVSVTAKMEKRFCDMIHGSPTQPRKKPSVLQTLLRCLLVQDHSLNAIGVQPADVVIEPDVTGFDLSAFMRAKELAAIGEQTTLKQIPKIKQLLTRLDPQLFPFCH